ncbi:hypothetical protein C8Q76DRAFT_760787 [Earliella scabrosa]|nr:hypothetical protein C8Q76DRAFT_760787 [Earliella scabrosa]
MSGSFTLVHDHSTKFKRISSSMFKSVQAASVESDSETVHEPYLERACVLPVAVAHQDLHEDDIALPDDPTNAAGNILPAVHSPPRTSSSVASVTIDAETAANPGPSTDPVKQSDSAGTLGLHTSSLSLYSVQSDKSDISASASLPLQSESTRSLSRRATDGSFASINHPPTRDRRFALRRQAIYAEYGFQIAYPESDSEGPSRPREHGDPQAPTSSSSQPTLKKGHPGRSASAYVFSASAPHPTWSASTSGASLNSVIDAYAGSGTSSSSVRALGALPDLPHPHVSGSGSDTSLYLAQGDDKLDRLSVHAELLASDRNPLLDSGIVLKTSTPPLVLKKKSSQSQRSLPSCSFSPSTSTTSTAAVNGSAHRPSSFAAYSGPSTSNPDCTLEPWAPLQVVKRDSTDPLVLCVSVSPSDRVERLALWEEDRGHHPIVEALLREVDRAMEEWRRAVTVAAYF